MSEFDHLSNEDLKLEIKSVKEKLKALELEQYSRRMKAEADRLGVILGKTLIEDNGKLFCVSSLEDMKATIGECSLHFIQTRTVTRTNQLSKSPRYIYTEISKVVGTYRLEDGKVIIERDEK